MSTSPPLVSIIIPAYNQAQYLQQSIESALAQSYEHYEIIVVDDGSTDETAAIAKSYSDQILYIYQENRGLAGARNSGIQAAKGEYTALLDADDLWSSNFLERMGKLIIEFPGAAGYYCAAQCIDENGNRLSQRVGFPTKPIFSPRDMYETLLRSNFLIPSTIILQRQLVLDVGLFDENLKSIEDWDLWLRLLPEYPFIGISDTLVSYRIHQKSLSANPKRMHNYMREVVEKHFGKDDGAYSSWPPEKRTAYGSLYRNYLVTSIQRTRDWHTGKEYLSQALKSDPKLAVNLSLFYDLALGNQPFGHRGTDYQLDLEENAHQIEQMLFNVFNSSDSNSELQTIKDKTYGTAFYALGLVAYNTNQRPRCRRFILKSLHFRPELWRDTKILNTLAKSFFSDTFILRLRHLRNFVVNHK